MIWINKSSLLCCQQITVKIDLRLLQNINYMKHAVFIQKHAHTHGNIYV